MSLVTTDWVLVNLNSLKIIDASWHMPAQRRNPADEYQKGHIPNSIFFEVFMLDIYHIHSKNHHKFLEYNRYLPFYRHKLGLRQ